MIALALLFVLTPQDRPKPTAPPAQPATPALTDRPAPTVQPTVPPIEPAEAPAPAPAELPRDGFVADRFTAEGMSVRYELDMRAGELSLLDLGNWGFARGWASTVGLKLIGPEGAVLLESSQPGGTVFHDFHAFVAPREGRYGLELSAPEHGYRYTLVRHSSYRPREAGQVPDLAAAPSAHGYLATPADRATYALELEAGQPVLLRASLTHPQGERQARALRGRQALRVAQGLPVQPGPARGAGRSEAAMRAMQRGAGLSSFPALVLDVRGPDGESVTSGRHAALFTPRADGRYLVTVAASGRGEGGLFELEVQRAPALVPVKGYVGDRDDDPVKGITAHLLREPGMELLGSATSDGEGAWSLSLPPGDYTVLFIEADGGPLERLQTSIETGRELNAIWPH